MKGRAVLATTGLLSGVAVALVCGAIAARLQVAQLAPPRHATQAPASVALWARSVAGRPEAGPSALGVVGPGRAAEVAARARAAGYGTRGTARTAAPVIIDTDAGSDDLMAIAFLLARSEVRIEAITIANGLAHVRAGGANVLRLLDLAGRRDIPVYLGREASLWGVAEFPAQWRELSDRLPGVELPAASRQPEAQSAAAFLRARLADPRRRVCILALGPLTNLGEVLAQAPASARAIEELVIMGGAVGVPGNLGDGGYFKTENTTAEWNLFVDPLAATYVFASEAPILLVPLDATSQVPIDVAFLGEFEATARTRLGRVVAQVLETDREFISRNLYFAWDPLAAAALVAPEVLRARPAAIGVSLAPREVGRTVELACGRAAGAAAVPTTACAAPGGLNRVGANSHTPLRTSQSKTPSQLSGARSDVPLRRAGAAPPAGAATGCRKNARIAYQADAAAFRRLFLRAFAP